MNRRDYSQLSVDEVKAAIAGGTLTALDARRLEVETRKTPRKSVMVLTDAGETPDDVDTPVPAAPVPGIDPKLVEERELQRAREQNIQRRAPQPATLDPKLAAIRDATKAKEASLRGRSLMQTPARGR